MLAKKHPQITASSHIVTLKAGDCLFKAGDWAESMFFVMEGTVAVVNEVENLREIARLKKGELFGERAYISKGGFARQFSVYAKTDVSLYEITRETLPEIEKAIPDLGRKIIHTLLNRLTRAEKMIQVLVPTDGRKRIVVALLSYKGPNDELCEVTPEGNVSYTTLEQIIDLTALDSQFVVKTIQELMQRQIIGLREKRFFIMSETALYQFGNLA